MKIVYYRVNAFTKAAFGGNPAGVCLLDEWLSDEQMQAVATEKRLSETAFLIQKSDYYALRWFTPKIEIDTGGHATLASAHVLFNHYDVSAESVCFQTKSGTITVKRERDLLVMDFPSWKVFPCTVPKELLEGLRIAPEDVLCSERDYFAVFDSEDKVRALSPNITRLKELDRFYVCVTAPGRESDFVSRFFAPGAGINEDPVTASTHSELVPYWSKRLGKDQLHALQLSHRGGELFCKDLGDRVSIAGSAKTYLKGVIHI